LVCSAWLSFCRDLVVESFCFWGEKWVDSWMSGKFKPAAQFSL